MSSLSLEVCKPRTINLVGIWDENLAHRLTARQETDVQWTGFMGSLLALRVCTGWHHHSLSLAMKNAGGKLLHPIVILLTSQPKIGEAKMDFILSISFPTPELNVLNSKMELFPFYENIKGICTIQNSFLYGMI